MDIKELLRDLELFSGLNKDELAIVAAICRTKEFEEQTEIFKEGDTDRDLYVLLEGKINIEIQLKLKSEKASVHTVSKGEVFGEFALVDGEVRSASATSVKKSKVIVVLKDDLDKTIEANPRIGYIIMKNFAKILCTRIRKTTRELKASLIWD